MDEREHAGGEESLGPSGAGCRHKHLGYCSHGAAPLPGGSWGHMLSSLPMETGADSEPLATWLARLKQSIGDESFVKLTLSRPRAKSDLKNIYFTLVRLKRGKRVQELRRYQTRDEFHHYALEEAPQKVEELLPATFLEGNLFTTTGNFALQVKGPGALRIRQSPATFTTSSPEPHNREKTRAVPENARFLRALGISDLHGRVRRDRYDKYRQIDKFVEIVGPLIAGLPPPTNRPFKIVDVGAGRSYLTLALHDLLARTMGESIQVVAVEQREDLVREITSIAEGLKLVGFEVVATPMASLPRQDTDVVVALHACDTATDDAIVWALASNARLIVLAPCCQKYLRTRMSVPAPLNAVTTHGIHEERFSSMLTDSLRALVLQAQGYETKVFEFISAEHTAKNTMLIAEKSLTPHRRRQEAAAQEIARLKAMFALPDFYLDTHLPAEGAPLENPLQR